MHDLFPSPKTHQEPKPWCRRKQEDPRTQPQHRQELGSRKGTIAKHDQRRPGVASNGSSWQWDWRKGFDQQPCTKLWTQCARRRPKNTTQARNKKWSSEDSPHTIRMRNNNKTTLGWQAQPNRFSRSDRSQLPTVGREYQASQGPIVAKPGDSTRAKKIPTLGVLLRQAYGR